MNTDIPKFQRIARHHGLHLGDHDAAVVVRGCRHLEFRSDVRLVDHGQVAVLVGVSGADEGHVRPRRLVEQVFLPVDGHQLHDAACLFCLLVAGAAVDPGISKGIQSDLGDQARTPSRGASEQIAHDAHGRQISWDLIVSHHICDGPRVGHVSGPHLAQQSVDGDLVRSQIVSLVGLQAFRLVARRDAAHEGDVPGMAFLFESFGETGVQFLRASEGAEPAADQRGVIRDNGHRLFQRYEF